MEFRYLRYLVAVAEKQSFTKAAETLGMAQPPLSQQIPEIEQEVGTPLFHRLTRSVELTEAGLSLYQDAKGILSQTEQAMQKAQRIARGQLGSLRLGFAGSTVLHPSVLRLIHDFRQAWPEVSLHPIENSMPNLVRDLMSEELDAAILRLPCSSSSALTHHLIDEEEMLIALPPHHPLASTDAIAIEALAQDPFILFPANWGRACTMPSPNAASGPVSAPVSAARARR